MMRSSASRRTSDPKLLRLGAVALLGSGREGDRRWLETVADEVEVRAGQVIVGCGELLRAVVVPADPEARVVWGAATRPSSVGYILGAVATASRRTQSITVAAAEPARLWVIPAAHFELARRRFPTVELAMIDEARKLMG